MKCEKCHIREATVHLTQVLNGEACTVHLCTECARRAGLDPSSPMEMNQLLSGTAHLYEELEKEIPEAMREAAEAMLREIREKGGGAGAGVGEGGRCPHCGMTLKQAWKGGRMGCPLCYEAFREAIRAHMEAEAPGARYRGRMPVRMPKRLIRQAEAMRLEAELAEAVAKEEYERAVGLRDRIFALEGSGES